MDKKYLEDEAAKRFILPDKKDYEGAGEAFMIETGIIKQRQQDFIDGGLCALKQSDDYAFHKSPEVCRPYVAKAWRDGYREGRLR